MNNDVTIDTEWLYTDVVSGEASKIITEMRDWLHKKDIEYYITFGGQYKNFPVGFTMNDIDAVAFRLKFLHCGIGTLQ